MEEKDMVMDILSNLKAGIGSYAKAISECSDQTLRKTLQQMRDGDEKSQYDLYQIASQKGYYVNPPVAGQLETSELKATLNQGMASLASI